MDLARFKTVDTVCKKICKCIERKRDKLRAESNKNIHKEADHLLMASFSEIGFQNSESTISENRIINEDNSIFTGTSIKNTATGNSQGKGRRKTSQQQHLHNVMKVTRQKLQDKVFTMVSIL